MAVKIQFRRDLAANWGSSTVLASGEVGYETDTGNIKIGNGSTQWSALAYYQLPNVSVNPATMANLNDAAYRVMGRYRLNSVTGGSTFTNGPSDLDAADADSYCAMIVTSHAYTALSTLIQQTLTQFSGNGTTLKQWVRMYDGTNYTAWTSTAHLSDGEVTTAKIADDAVTAAKLADSASTDGDRAVTTDHIRNSAVTTAKIADANVTTAKIADNAVTAAKLADDASTDANRAVTTDHIRDSAVTTAKIAADAVTFPKIQNSAAAGLSVVGRSANSAGDFAEIAAGTDGHVLRRSGTALGFGTIATAGIADSAVTAAKCGTDVLTNVSTRVGCIGFITADQTDTGGLQTITSSYPAGVFSISSNKIISTAGTWTGFAFSASGNGSDSGSFTVATTAASSTSVPAPPYVNGQAVRLLAVLIRVS